MRYVLKDWHVLRQRLDFHIWLTSGLLHFDNVTEHCTKMHLSVRSKLKIVSDDKFISLYGCLIIMFCVRHQVFIEKCIPRYWSCEFTTVYNVTLSVYVFTEYRTSRQTYLDLKGAKLSFSCSWKYLWDSNSEHPGCVSVNVRVTKASTLTNYQSDKGKHSYQLKEWQRQALLPTIRVTKASTLTNYQSDKGKHSYQLSEWQRQALLPIKRVTKASTLTNYQSNKSKHSYQLWEWQRQALLPTIRVTKASTLTNYQCDKGKYSYQLSE